MDARRPVHFLHWFIGSAAGAAVAIALALDFANKDENDAATGITARPAAQAAAALGAERGPSVLEVIEQKMLNDPRQPLWGDRGPNVLEEELAALGEDDLFAALRYRDRYIRWGAEREFERRAASLSEDARSRLRLLIDTEPKMSSMAIRSLSKSGPTGVDRLAPLLGGADRGVAVQVAQALLQAKPLVDATVRERAVEVLFEAMKDGNPRYDIGEITRESYPQLLPRLRELVRDRSRPAEVRANAASVLRRQTMGFKETASGDDLPLLLSLLRDEEEKVRERIAQGLDQFPKSAEVMQAAKGRVRDPSESVRIYVRSYLSSVEPAVKVPPTASEIATARHRLLDPSPSVNDGALYCVKRHDDRNAMAWLVRLLAREPDKHGRLTYAQVRAGRLIAELTGKEFGNPRNRNFFDSGSNKTPNYGFNEYGFCGNGAPPLEWHVERGRRLGGTLGNQIADEAAERMESNACDAHAWEHALNQTHLEERERVLLWWEKEGRWEYPPVIELALE